MSPGYDSSLVNPNGALVALSLLHSLERKRNKYITKIQTVVQYLK